MTKYREIIRMTSLGFSQCNIMASCGVAQKTVVKVQKRARELNLVWPLEETMTDIKLQKLLFQKEDKVELLGYDVDLLKNIFKPKSA